VSLAGAESKQKVEVEEDTLDQGRTHDAGYWAQEGKSTKI
jgi:hypothetical protein